MECLNTSFIIFIFLPIYVLSSDFVLGSVFPHCVFDLKDGVVISICYGYPKQIQWEPVNSGIGRRHVSNSTIVFDVVTKQIVLLITY